MGDRHAGHHREEPRRREDPKIVAAEGAGYPSTVAQQPAPERDDLVLVEGGDYQLRMKNLRYDPSWVPSRLDFTGRDSRPCGDTLTRSV